MNSTDTSQAYDFARHVPDIRPFASLSEQERKSLVFFYEAYIVQSQSDLRRIKNLHTSNQNLLKLVNAQLEK
jgi:hypothetical protein